MREQLYNQLANFFSAIQYWFRYRAEGLHHDRMLRLYPVGTKIRIDCDCEDWVAHEGVWFVYNYDADAGDFRVCRELPANPINLPEKSEFLRPEQMKKVD